MSTNKLEMVYTESEVKDLILKITGPLEFVADYDTSSYIDAFLKTYREEAILSLPGGCVSAPFSKKYPNLTIAQIYLVDPAYVEYLMGCGNEEVAEAATTFSDCLPSVGKKTLSKKRPLEIDYTLNEEQRKTLYDMPEGRYTLDFGKFKGKQLLEVYQCDRLYLNYLYRKSFPDVRPKVAGFIEGLTQNCLPLDGIYQQVKPKLE